MISNVLVTAIGGTSGSGVVEALAEDREIHVLGVDANRFCPLQNRVQRFEVVPLIDDPDYQTAIHDLVEENDIEALIPTLHSELKLIPELGAFAPVLSSGFSSIEKVLDKTVMYTVLADEVPELIPGYREFASLDELAQSAKQLGYPDRPVYLKGRHSYGGLGMMVLSDRADVARRRLHSQSSNWATLQDALDLLSSYSSPSDYYVTEFLEEPEFSVDTLMLEGELVSAVTRERTKTRGIVVSGSTVFREDLIEASAQVLRALNLDYFTNLQFRFSSLGEPKLIDVNPRFGGSQVHSLGAGVNFPSLCVRAFTGRPYSVPEPIWGVRMERFWQAVYFVKNE